MTRFVIGPDVALQLARDGARIAMGHQLVAPTLLRSQVLSFLYREVQCGAMEAREAERRLDYLRGLRIRLLGDRALQRAAWKVAVELGWPDTFDAEYVALTQLQADAFVTLDLELARSARKLVKLAEPEALFLPAGAGRRAGNSGGRQRKLPPKDGAPPSLATG
jgi:predicted nucleic acid-binding protein